MVRPGHEIGPMTPDEVTTIVEWAAAEGWNPGRHDAAIASNYDPEAFIALRVDGEFAGGGTILSYAGAFGFMGLFIIRPDLRSVGLGRELWMHRRDRLVARLRPGAAVGMDGVFDLEPFYARGGFRRAHRDLRFEGTAHGVDDAETVPLADLAHDEWTRYDRTHVAAPRDAFIDAWLAAPGVIGLGIVEDGRLRAAGVLRPSRVGWKFGPLTADRPELAHRLAGALLARIDGQPVQLDVPEPNEHGLALAEAFGLRESFGCARMYLGPPPDLPLDRIYGVTSFEFG
jgi:hypothetical protein